MPSMEVYSGNPSDETQHFEDWMQTQYSGLTVELGKWLDLSDNDRATMFLSQLNTYFQKRTELLGKDGAYLFPRQRPGESALQVNIAAVMVAHCNPCFCCSRRHLFALSWLQLLAIVHLAGSFAAAGQQLLALLIHSMAVGTCNLALGPLGPAWRPTRVNNAINTHSTIAVSATCDVHGAIASGDLMNAGTGNVLQEVA